MITIKNICEKSLAPNIGTKEERSAMEICLTILNTYYSLKDDTDTLFVLDISIFVRFFFEAMHFFCKYDAVHPEILEFLEYIVNKIDKFKVDKEGGEKFSPVDLEKIAMIYQTAADKSKVDGKIITESQIKSYKEKAEFYIKRVAEIRKKSESGSSSPMQASSNEKMYLWYSDAAEQCKLAFIAAEIRHRAAAYRHRVMAEHAGDGKSYGLFSSLFSYFTSRQAKKDAVLSSLLPRSGSIYQALQQEDEQKIQGESVVAAAPTADQINAVKGRFPKHPQHLPIMQQMPDDIKSEQESRVGSMWDSLLIGAAQASQSEKKPETGKLKVL
jgi:hypothetical protein